MNSPPRSATWPGKNPRSVEQRPPTWPAASNTCAVTPLRASSEAQLSPARPAPTTATLLPTIMRRSFAAPAQAVGVIAPAAAVATPATAPCVKRRRLASRRASCTSASRSMVSCALCPVFSACAAKRAKRSNCAIFELRLMVFPPDCRRAHRNTGSPEGDRSSLDRPKPGSPDPDLSQRLLGAWSDSSAAEIGTAHAGRPGQPGSRPAPDAKG